MFTGGVDNSQHVGNIGWRGIVRMAMTARIFVVEASGVLVPLLLQGVFVNRHSHLHH